ncbi:hypothetical protein L1787_13370 [Acuticoccus sp. M5D2P5]|uniref:hypothetical protein n=1 Tax=Acuticoccus kalidii TaxID=2910977 RepID=UPI001F218CB3|nr:hypothetical protein [Acuticoccus kalidii]MCF3934395.1 hypothetical protein [Acuticoccus kalidii]
MKLEELRRLCAKYWNPIGIPMSNIETEDSLGYRPLPADEYDTYLAHIQTLIQSKASMQDIREYLEIVERDYIMLSSPSGSKDAFIRALQEASGSS